MDIFFNRRHTYTVNLTLEDVRENIQSITTRKWFDFSENITGRMTSSGEYILHHKWSVFYTYGIRGMPAYLKVKLIRENNRTRIKTVLRPNLVLVIGFYFIVTLFFFELTGNSFPEGRRVAALIFLPVFDAILFGLMMLFASGLKNKFEKIMQLR